MAIALPPEPSPQPHVPLPCSYGHQDCVSGPLPLTPIPSATLRIVLVFQNARDGIQGLAHRVQALRH